MIFFIEAQLKQQQLDSLDEKVADNEKKNGMKLQVTDISNNLTISHLQKQIKDITEKRKYKLSLQI